MKEIIHKKLLIRKADKFLICNTPEELKEDFDEFTNEKGHDEEYNFVLLFAYGINELKELLTLSIPKSENDCLFWACYPKGTSKIKSDLNRSTLVDTVKGFDFRPVTQISINETWTAMRLRPQDQVGK